MAEPAAEAADDGDAEGQEPLADRAGIHDGGGDNEERHGQDDEAVVETLDDLLGGEAQILALYREIDDGCHQHRIGDGRTDPGEHQQHQEACRKGDAHVVSGPPTVTSRPRRMAMARRA